MLIGNIQVWVPACSTSDAGEISMREGLTSASARQSQDNVLDDSNL